jgi:hypothetical protein
MEQITTPFSHLPGKRFLSWALSEEFSKERFALFPYADSLCSFTEISRDCRFLRVVAFCGWSLFAKEYNHPCKGDQLGKVPIFEVGSTVHTYPAGSGCSVKKAVSFYAGFHARDAKVLSGASPGVNNDRSIDSILAMGQGWFRL